MIPLYFFENCQMEHGQLMSWCAENWFEKSCHVSMEHVQKEDCEEEGILKAQKVQNNGRTGHCLQRKTDFWQMEKMAGGKPFFKNAPEKGVSFSDSRNFCLVALAEGQVGVDLQFLSQGLKEGAEAEDVKKRADHLVRLARRFFHPAEKDFVEAAMRGESSHEGVIDRTLDLFRRFMLVWTAKESYVKYSGKGIGPDFSTFSVLPTGNDFGKEMNQSWQAQGLCFQNLFFGKNLMDSYMVCICTDRPEKVICRRVDSLFLDLDGTVLYGGKPLSRENRQAMEMAMAAGMEVVVASGRPFSALEKSVVEIPGLHYAITSNGAAIYDLQKGKKIHEALLPAETIEKILRMTEEVWRTGQVNCEIFIDGKGYTGQDYWNDPEFFGASKTARKYVQSTRTAMPDIRAFALENKNCISGFDFVIGNQEIRKTMWDLFEAQRDLYVTASMPNRVELSDVHAGKKAAMDYLLGLIGGKRFRAAAFGDGDNDMEMIQAAGLGFAVANATEKCKKAADYIIPPVQENGFAWTVGKLLSGWPATHKMIH